MAEPVPSHFSLTAEVLCIGDELLRGDVVNTNGSFLAQRLRLLGIDLRRIDVVADVTEAIVEAVRTAANRCSVLVITGGLGPTSDDLTTVAVAAAADVSVVRDTAAQSRLEQKFREFRRAMPETNRKQADRPENATWLANPIGTAEGFTLTIGTCTVYVTPGVPMELHRMMLEQIEPALREKHALGPRPRRIYRLLGLGESAVAERVEPILTQAQAALPANIGLQIHYRASMPEVLVMFEVLGTNHLDHHDLWKALDSSMVEVLTPHLYGIGEASLAARTISALRTNNRRVALAESCTGGLASAMLVAQPGASHCFDGTIVAYQNRIKRDLLGVSQEELDTHGAVSEAVACAMAQGALRVLASDFAIGITGIAGPGGGSADKPVGTVHMAIADGSNVAHRKLQLRGDRAAIAHSAATWARKLLWDRLHALGLTQIHVEDPP